MRDVDDEVTWLMAAERREIDVEAAPGRLRSLMIVVYRAPITSERV